MKLNKIEFGTIAERQKEKYNPVTENAAYPCIELEHLSQGTGILLGYTNSKDQKSIKNKFKKGDILFGKLRPYLKKYLQAPFEGVCSSEIWVLKGKMVTNEYLLYFIQSPKFNFEVNLTSGSKMPRADWNYISNVKFYVHNEKEQRQLANLFLKIDLKISLIIKKIEELEQYKKGIVQKIFSQEIRFKDQDGDDFQSWENKKLGNFLFEHKLKSTGNEEVFSVSVHKGLVNQIEHLGRVFAAKNTDKYNLVKPYDIVYTKSPTGDFPLGIIKQSKIKDKVIVSPLYGVFTPKTKGLGYLLDAYFESPVNTSNYLSSIIQKGAKNTINITNNTFLSKKITLPTSTVEQEKIGRFIESIDLKINQTKLKLDEMKNWKKGLLQKMFV